MTDTLEGGCFCKAVRFRTQGEPRFVSTCYCESCRRASSAPAVVWAGFTDAQVSFEGAPARYTSSPGVERLFCPRCGSQICYRSDKYPGETHLTVCSFDAPEQLPPKGDHLAEERIAWDTP